jgi:hypothetical protein
MFLRTFLEDLGPNSTQNGARKIFIALGPALAGLEIDDNFGPDEIIILRPRGKPARVSDFWELYRTRRRDMRKCGIFIALDNQPPVSFEIDSSESYLVLRPKLS